MSSAVGLLCVAYLSTLDDFFRSIFDLGLSNVDAEEPETNEGVPVRTLGGGGSPWRCADAA